MLDLCREQRYSTLLRANGEDVKVVQELLRYANSRITLDIYTQAMTPAKRQAQSKIIEMILPEKRRLKRTGPELDPDLTVTLIAIHS
jgi:hypothetical protein